MPSKFLNKISEERNISMRALEDIYDKAKSIAIKKYSEDDPEYYAHTTQLFKSMLGMSSHSSVVALSKKIPDRIESVSECFTAE